MKIYESKDGIDLKVLLQRPQADTTAIQASVREIIQQVKAKGDEALTEYGRMFDGVDSEDLVVEKHEFDTASDTISKPLKSVIQLAADNIRRFHEKQPCPVRVVETMPGVVCKSKTIAIKRVGLYIPGGTAPLFSTVLMLAIPAKLAGCEEIVLCTPPRKDGSVHPAILYAASVAGVKMIYKVGGAQAIAAMAYGTKTIPAVYKIFGPGNQFVTIAKQLVQLDAVAIDMPAGPSELCVLADDTADISFLAADLLSQAEHGSDSQVLLITTSSNLAGKVIIELENQLQQLERKEIATKALENSKAFIVSDVKSALELINTYAPEHLIINHENEDAIAEEVNNAGSIFIGKYSAESAGDYASGTNHTLPTNGFARSHSGITIDSFLKTISYQKISAEGIRNLGPAVETMAEAEGLQAHAKAITLRLKSLE